VGKFSFSIDVPIRNEWANIDLLLTSVKYCFAAMLSDVDGCETMAMVTGELLENAIKYGDWSGRDRTFRFQVAGEGRRATVAVENPVRDVDEALRTIEGTLAWIRGFPSTEEAYRARLLEASTSKDAVPGGASRLGLVRIAYQASCKLSAEPAGKCVRVVAEVDLAAH
jgi:hypothetical protein